MNDFLWFLLAFPAFMHLAGHLLFGPDWFVKRGD